MKGGSVLKRFLDFVADKSSNDTAGILIMLTSAGWLASSLAQIAGIYFNKNYTKEQKSFMIPQELADAVVNIGSFLLITKSLKALTTKMVDTGKLIPNSIRRFLVKNGMGSEIGKFGFNITEVEGFNKYNSIYNNFKMASESTAAILGGIFSSNILTPILRNKIAAKRKDMLLKHLGGKTEDVKETGLDITDSSGNNGADVTTSYPCRHTFEDFRRGADGADSVKVEGVSARNRFEDFRKTVEGSAYKPVMGTGVSFSNGGMRI